MTDTADMDNLNQTARTDKWAAFRALANPAACDAYAQKYLGITLHAGSTADEIDRAVNAYRTSW